MRKLLFGTDWPIHRFYGDQKKWVDAFRDLRADGVVNEQEYAMIMRENIAGLLPESALRMNDVAEQTREAVNE